MGYLNAVVSEATGTLRRASEGIKITVDQHNIMQAARIIEIEAEYFKRKVYERAENLEVYPMGGDPVSRAAARALTKLFLTDGDSYYNRCLQYAAMLHDLAEQLYASAQTYGFTEEHIKAHFDAATAAGGEWQLFLAPPTPKLPHGGLHVV